MTDWADKEALRITAEFFMEPTNTRLEQEFRLAVIAAALREAYKRGAAETCKAMCCDFQ